MLNSDVPVINPDPTVSIAPQGDVTPVVDDLGEIAPVPSGPEAAATEIPFDANLAEYLPDDVVEKIVEEYLDNIESDRLAREKWCKIAARGQALLGLQIEEADLDKAASKNDDRKDWWTSKAVHPVLAEAIARFQAQASGELFPPDGPAKGHVIAPSRTKDLESQADRVASLINWITTDLLPEYGDQTEKLLWCVPLEGTCFTKVTYDPSTFFKRKIVRAEDVYLPWHATTFYEAERVTHHMRWSMKRIKALQAQGWILPDVEITEGSSVPDRSRSEEQADKSIGQDVGSADGDADDLIDVYECYAVDRFAGPGLPDKDLPYVLTFARDDRKLLSLRRNWMPSTDGGTYKPWRLITPYSFLPGDHRGPYAYGLVHMIGALSEAATVAFRSAIDAASFHAKPAGFLAQILLNDPKFDKSALQPGELRGVPGTMDDVKRSIYMLPPGDLAAIQAVLEFIVTAAQRFASTADLQVGVGDNRAPVGTTLALLEKGSEIYTSIHRRLHRAQRNELTTISSLIGEYTPEGTQYPYPCEPLEDGSTPDVNADFDHRVDVAPVSDPHIASSSQRIAIAQGVVQMAAQFPQQIDPRAACEQMLRVMKVGDPDAYLQQTTDAERADSVSENSRILMSEPVAAFPDQDHAAHMMVHQTWFQGLPPEGQKMLQPVFMAHMGEHLAFQYRAQMEAMIAQATGTIPGQMLPPPPVPKNVRGDDRDDGWKGLPPEAERIVDAVAAQVAQVMASQQAQQRGAVGEDQAAAMQANAQADATAQKREAAQMQDARERDRMQMDAAKAAGDLQLRGAVEQHKADMDKARLLHDAHSSAMSRAIDANNRSMDREAHANQFQQQLDAQKASSAGDV